MTFKICIFGFSSNFRKMNIYL